MKYQIFLLLFVAGFNSKAQKVDSLFVNLYTDSLKKGTYNYINIDGKLSDGRYLPLDSNAITFWSDDGTFSGNDLWIPFDIKKEKVRIRVRLKTDTAVQKEFFIYIKQAPDPELKTEEELLNEMRSKTNRKPGKSVRKQKG